MEAASSPRLGELLRARGLVPDGELQAALAFQANQTDSRERLGAILVRLGSVSLETLEQVLSGQLGLSLSAEPPPTPDEVQRGLALWGLKPEWWRAHRALPWCDESGHVAIAASDPLDTELREVLQAARPAEDVRWLLLRDADQAAWLRSLEGELTIASSGTQVLDADALRQLAQDAPIIAFVNNVMAQAVEARASDVHLEPGEREFDVRFRVDGVLQTRQSQAMDRFPAVASRIKLIAGLDIAERRLPQDGRTSLRVAGQDMDVRVSSIPAVHGESIVMRLLPKQRQDLRLDRLGMSHRQLAQFRAWLQGASGLVLVTGPTGSGKSTTLYGALADVNDRSRKIVTVEDPVEYRLPHVIQIQTQAEIGYTFARALRSILRHDPDIIMVGEIRDRETAEIAIQSALTGHLVLATLHTNDALSAITRLVDMGIEPYLVAAALRATMAQRLVRRLCECAEAAEPDEAVLVRWRERFGAEAEGMPTRWRRPQGCVLCQGTGYRGRVGIHELVDVSPEIQHAVASGATVSEVLALADRAGRIGLLDDGIRKCALGETHPEEVWRVAGSALAEVG